MDTDEKITELGYLVRKLKREKADKAEINKAVNELLKLKYPYKNELKFTSGH